ncbi:MAG TPA: sulfatase-like hydrolase/transferase, partial [Saprospiraceae bacterium]|nr:sulfatase-like hydrolase/transferase [Saprospiraceae bacterium]
MKQAFSFPLRLLLFWLLFFAAFRLWFVLWFRTEWAVPDGRSVWGSFWHALPLDLSMAGYLMVLPVLMWFVGMAWRSRAAASAERASRPIAAVRGFHFLLISVLVLVFGANVFLYEEWHTPLNNRALAYMSTPMALLDSMSFGFILAAIGLYVAVLGLFWWLYRRLVEQGRVGERTASPFRLWHLLFLPIWLAAIALLIRGGLRTMPINESAVYYSPHSFDNHAATNTAWHLAHSQMEVKATTNHFRTMPDEEAQRDMDWISGRRMMDRDARYDLFAPRADSIPMNLVMLILESHSAQVVQELGGEPGVCPNLSGLIRRGILFDSCYSSGYRTDQGLVSVLAGYPAQPDQSIVLQSEKAAKLPSLPRVLGEMGYSTAFLYGGELTFANIGVWLTEQRLGLIRSEQDFSKADKTQRWGVDDHRLFQHALLEINRLQPPFFAAALSLSLHPPYDVPYQSRWAGDDIRSKFLHSAAFTDWAIGEFFRSAAQQPWYANTLFVLVADHGTASIGDTGQDDPLARHIPLLFYSPRLNAEWAGRRVSLHCGHHDIPSTALKMLLPESAWAVHMGDFPW